MAKEFKFGVPIIATEFFKEAVNKVPKRKVNKKDTIYESINFE